MYTYFATLRFVLMKGYVCWSASRIILGGPRTMTIDLLQFHLPWPVGQAKDRLPGVWLPDACGTCILSETDYIWPLLVQS